MMNAMTADQARLVLQGMQASELSAERLAIALDYVESEIGDNQGEGARKLRLDGYFNADQLEAMAFWLRNPSAVSGER